MTGKPDDRVAALALGSNLGEARAHLVAAVEALQATAGVSVLRVSSVYRTAPVGGPLQPDYLNAVVLVRTGLSALDLVGVAQRIEHQQGRVRKERWGPRTLDVDVLSVGEEVSTDPVAEVPHPRVHERAFVLVPWAEVDPEARLPGHGTVLEALAALPATEVGAVRRGRVGALPVPQPAEPPS